MKPKLFTRVLALSLILAISLACSLLTSMFEPGLNLEEGETYHMRTIVEQEISQDMGSLSEDIERTIGMEIALEVVEIDEDGNYWIDMTHDWVLYEQETPLDSVSYDSDDPPDPIPPTAMGYAALVGKGFSVLISPSGEPLETEGLDEMVNEVIADMGLFDLAPGDMIEEITNEMIDDMEDNLIQMTVSGPEGPTGVGDTWTTSRSMTGNLIGNYAMTIDSTWTLESLGYRIATINEVSDVTPNEEEAEPIDLGGLLPVGYTLSGGSQEGTYHVQLSTGLISQATINQDLSGEATVIGLVEETWSISIESTTTIEMVEGD